MLRDPSNKCNGMTRDNDGNLLVCEHVTSSLVRESPDGTPRDDRVPLGRAGAEQPERRDRRLRRLDHLHRPDLRPHAGLRLAEAAGSRLPGCLPPAGGRRRHAAPDRRLRAAERALLLAGRIAALHQRHGARAHPRLRRRRRSQPLERPRLRLRDRHRRHVDRRARRRDEARRARQRLRDRARRASGSSRPTASTSA